MRGRPQPIEALIGLHRAPEISEQRARWRQAFTYLGQQTRIDGPPPLDGVDIGSISQSCRAALDSGFADELDWIGREQALVALYELTQALPPGNERREFGKRVYQGLYGGAAGPFVAVARRMAWSGVRQLETPSMRARVSLCFSLPVGSPVNTAPLALALVCGRERFAAWVGKPSTATLPERRLAARILERAAQEATRAAFNGDPYPSEWLLGPSVRPTFESLLADREPLVWRHVARARGVLSAVAPTLREEIEQELDPGLSPTEWRRALVSLVACLGHDASTALGQCRHLLLKGGLSERHPALLSTALWGLAPVIESDPDTAEELLDAVVSERLRNVSSTAVLDLADELSTLRGHVHNPAFAEQAARRLADALQSLEGSDTDPLLRALVQRTRTHLSEPAATATLRGKVRQALAAYETLGALPARDLATGAIEQAHELLTSVEAASLGEPSSTPAAFLDLSEIGVGVLERSPLRDLLLLGQRPGESHHTTPQYSSLLDRLGHWLLRAEQARQPSSAPSSAAMAIVQRRQLVIFLQLLDTQGPEHLHDEDSILRARRRVRGAVLALLQHLADRPDPSIHRVICAALARSFDAAVRDNLMEPSDLLLLVMSSIDEHSSVLALLEGSTEEDMRGGLRAFNDLLGVLEDDEDSDFHADLPRPRRVALAVIQFSAALGGRGSYRGEALRQALLRLGRALEAIASARALTELVADDSGNRNWLEDLESALDGVRALHHGAWARVRGVRPPLPSLSRSLQQRLPALLEQTVSAQVPLPTADLRALVHDLVQPLPAPLRRAVSEGVERLAEVPVRLSTRVSPIPLKTRRAALPDWLLPRRTIGGFYVVRALGTGGVSTVFVAKRLEERKNPNAETYALKVPHYDPATARSLSEQEFMEMFRDEAGALLSLPEHPNLSGFVNFDMAAKPKPILVMELIAGQALEKLILRRTLTAAQVFRYLDGLLAGLGAMHGSGIAHLDIKPSNIILREDHTPVLVDFGLSGRQLRPGCGTLEYCAPEVLGLIPEGYQPEAPRADIYAFACTAYEMLTGKLLFDGESESAIMQQHVAHDGWPEALASWSEQGPWRPVATLLGACLRRDPRSRPSTHEIRAALQKFLHKQDVERWTWPLLAGAPAGAELAG